MNTKLFGDHLYHIYDTYISNESEKDMFSDYVIALVYLVDNKVDNKYVENIKNNTHEYVVDVLFNYLRIYGYPTTLSWGPVAWNLLYTLPILLEQNKNNAYYIKKILDLMPHVGLNCKSICAPHMIKYMELSKPDLSSPEALYKWISNFHISTKTSKK